MFPNGGRTDDAGYHIYGVIWSQDEIQFYRDDYTHPFFTLTPSSPGVNGPWVFDQPFFIILNLAIGDSLVNLDRVENAARFTIAPADVYGTGKVPRRKDGILALAARWEVDVSDFSPAGIPQFGTVNGKDR